MKLMDWIGALIAGLVLIAIYFAALGQTTRDINTGGLDPRTASPRTWNAPLPTQDPETQRRREAIKKDTDIFLKNAYDATGYRLIRDIILKKEEYTCEDKLMVIEVYIKAHEKQRPAMK